MKLTIELALKSPWYNNVRSNVAREVKKHLMKINKMNKKDVVNYINEAFKKYRERSKHKYELDISCINNYKN